MIKKLFILVVKIILNFMINYNIIKVRTIIMNNKEKIIIKDLDNIKK
jgi:hypothetical protein